METKDDLYFAGRDYLAGWHISDLSYVQKYYQRPLLHANKVIYEICQKIFPLESLIRDSTQDHVLINKSQIRQFEKLKIKLHFWKERKNQVSRKFETLLKRAWYDQTAFDSDANKHFQPYDILTKSNRVVRPGIDRCGDLIVGESILVWTHVALGEGTSDVKPSDESLELERVRVSIKQVGALTALGDAIRLFAIIPSGTNDALFTEVGGFDSPVISSGTMWFRSKFTDNKVLKHTKNETFPTVYHIIYMSSK